MNRQCFPSVKMERITIETILKLYDVIVLFVMYNCPREFKGQQNYLVKSDYVLPRQ